MELRLFFLLLFALVFIGISCDSRTTNNTLQQASLLPIQQNQNVPLQQEPVLKREKKEESEKDEDDGEWKFSSIAPGPWQKSAIQYAYQVMDHHFDASKTVQDFPDLNHEQFEYERIYFTIYVDHHTRGCQSSAKPNLKECIQEAVIRTIEDARFGGELKESEIQRAYVSFNVVTDQRPILSRTVEGITSELDLGLDGITLIKGKKRAFFKESVFISFNFNMPRLLERLSLKAELPEDAYTKETTQLYAHRMMSFSGDRSAKPINLFRYQELVDRSQVTPTEIQRRLKLARNWLLDKRSEFYGFLHYEYIPSHDSFSETDSNIRQMGTLWSIAKYANFYNDAEMKALAAEGLDYVLDFQKKEGDKIYICPPNDDAKIAYNAFVLLALVEIENYPLREQIMAGLYRALVGQQRPDGGFDTIFKEQTERGIDFYPGETLTAMAAYAEKTNHLEAYDVIAKAYPYYSAYFRKTPTTAFVPWHSQAYTSLYLHTKDRKYADFVLEINDWLIDTHQILKNPAHPDMLGGFRKDPNYSSTAFSEGVACAFHVAKTLQDPQIIKKYEESFTLALRFIFQLQYDENDVFFFKGAPRVLGGIRTSLTDTKQRIDMAQHFIHALQLSDQFKLFEKGN